MSPKPEQPIEVLGCRREFPERNYERCGKSAAYIFWGKLFDKEHLGPRCRNCTVDQLGSMARISDYAVYELPDLDALRKQGAEEERERLSEGLRPILEQADTNYAYYNRNREAVDQLRAALDNQEAP